MSEQGVREFKKIIAERRSVASPQDDELLEPLHDLVVALNETGVGAKVALSQAGRFSLVLWPPHRPGRTSMMLTFARQAGHLVAFLQSGTRVFETQHELRAFLEEFAGSSNFAASLGYLYEQGTWPVEAVLRARNSKAIIGIPPDDQRRLAEAGSEDLHIQLQLDDGEELPADFEPTQLESAGLQFDISNFSVVDRVLRADLRRRNV